VLELRNARFYIGSCKQLGKAIGGHFNGKSLDWTTENPVVRVAQVMKVIIEMGSYREYKNRLFLYCIARYGWNNVRGGPMPPKM